MSAPSGVVEARSLMEMKSDELLYVLLFSFTLLAILEYHLPSKDSPRPMVPLKIIPSPGYVAKVNPRGTRPAQPIRVQRSATLPS